MRRTLTARRFAASLALPLALATLAACGSDDGERVDASSDAPVSEETTAEDDEPRRKKGGKGTKGAKGESPAASPSEAAQEPTGSPSAAPSAAPGRTGQTLTPAEFVSLFRDSVRGTVHMTMSVAGPVQTRASGDLDYSTTPPSMAVTMNNAELGGDIEVVLVDDVIYMNMGPLSNGKYLKMALDDPSAMMGSDVTSQLDPRESLAQLEKGITSITYVGEEQVDGTPASRYTVVVDPAKIAAGAGGGKGMPKQITYDVWFDDQDRLRRTVLDMGPGNGVVTKTLSGWGEKVSITAPPAGQVAEMPGPGF